MIINHDTINLFGKKIFEKAIVKPPFKNLNILSNEACFLHVLEGENASYSEEEHLIVHQHDAVLMKCGKYIYEGKPDAISGNFGLIAIHFYPEILLKIYKHDIPEFLKSGKNTPFKRNMALVKSDHLIQKYIEGLLFYIENPEMVTEELIVLKIKEIILLLLNSKNGPAILNIMYNLFANKDFSFNEIVEAHIFSPITISDLANLTNRSLASFKREFRNVYHDSPANFIKNKRLEKAAVILRMTENSISSIAYDCQFNNLAHFSTAFKAKFNVTPSVYRMSQKQK